MPKFIRVGNEYVEEDPDFDPEEWQKEVPQEKMFREQLRETMDITQDEEQMGALVDAIRNGDPEKRERLVGIETDSAGFRKDGSGGYIDSKGQKITEQQMSRINRVVDNAMFNTDLRIREYPDYIQKELKERIR